MSAVLKQENIPSLAPDRMQVGDFVRQWVCVTVEVGTKPEWLLDPQFWAHVANKVRPYDRIEARCDDGEFFAEYLVLQRGPQWLQVRQLSMHKLGADIADDARELAASAFESARDLHRVFEAELAAAVRTIQVSGSAAQLP